MLKLHDNNVASMDVQLHATNKILVLEILVLGYFGECWAFPGMSDQTQQILHDLTKASMDV